MARGLVAAIAACLAAPAWGADAPEPQRYSPDEVRAALADILARPEYNDPFSKFADQVEALVAAAVRLVRELFRAVQDLLYTAPLLYWLIVAGCLVVLFLLLGHIAWTLYHAVAMDRRGPERNAAGAPPVETPASLRAQAEQAASGGAYLDAIRLLLRSIGVEMRRRGRTALFRSLTNREFAGEFRDEPALFGELSGFVELLDDRWYGMHPCDEKDYVQCRRAYDKVMGGTRA
jgi:hypothetical protein